MIAGMVSGLRLVAFALLSVSGAGFAQTAAPLPAALAQPSPSSQANTGKDEPGPSQAAGGLGLAGPIRWGMSLGLHTYREPDMRLTGPMLGLRAAAPLQVGDWPVLLEAEVAVGIDRYTSASSGTLDGVNRVASVWHLLVGPARTGLLPRVGLSLTTDWTDLRGQTSKGLTGYERLNQSLWLGAQWLVAREERAAPWRLRAGVLLTGRQSSYFSQVSASYGDVLNRQNRGALVELEAPWRFAGVDASLRMGFKAYADSNLALAPGYGVVYEPANRALELGITIWR